MANYFDPVQSLREEHNLILARLNVFEMLMSWMVRSSPIMPQMESVMQFLTKGVPGHSLKEEECLFPELLAMEDFHPGWKTIMAQDTQIRQAISDLQAAWEQFKRVAEADADVARDAVLERGQKLLRQLREHIYEEESLLFRFADRTLTRAQKEEIAHRMRHLEEHGVAAPVKIGGGHQGP